jgi:peroxiredoxin
LDRLSWYDEGRKFSVIGISTDDYPDAAKGFLAKTKITFPNFIDRKLELEAMLGADRLPLTILVGADGKIISKHYGAKAWDEPEALALVGKAFGFKP